MVVGGHTGTSILSSTELYVTGAASWRTVSPLPDSVYAMRGFAVANSIYMSGMIFY